MPLFENEKRIKESLIHCRDFKIPTLIHHVFIIFLMYQRAPFRFLLFTFHPFFSTHFRPSFSHFLPLATSHHNTARILLVMHPCSMQQHTQGSTSNSITRNTQQREHVERNNACHSRCREMSTQHTPHRKEHTKCRIMQHMIERGAHRSNNIKHVAHRSNKNTESMLNIEERKVGKKIVEVGQ